jgi:hypothetical protein
LIWPVGYWSSAIGYRRKTPLAKKGKICFHFFGHGHRPSTFRHWVDMIFEIANDCA